MEQISCWRHCSWKKLSRWHLVLMVLSLIILLVEKLKCLFKFESMWYLLIFWPHCLIFTSQMEWSHDYIWSGQVIWWCDLWYGTMHLSKLHLFIPDSPIMGCNIIWRASFLLLAWNGAVRVNCLAQEHNIMSLSRTQTLTTQSRVQ